MTKFVAEKNFFTFFQAFGTYFLDEILNKNWRNLIHQGSADYYISSLTEELYNIFTNNGIDNHAHMIHINWRWEEKIVDLQLLSDLIRIPLSQCLNQIPISLEEYMSLIGENCRATKHGGIDAKTVFRNVHATYRWLSTKSRVSHMTTFYNQVFHIGMF